MAEPDDTMPVFVIKAKDTLAPEAVQAYRALCTKYDLREQAAQVQLALDEIRVWQRDHHDQVRMPNHQHAAAGTRPDTAAAGPRTWALLPEPGPEVTRVKDVFGQDFNREHHVCGPDLWIGTTFVDDPDIPDLMLEWPNLMGHHAPLTNATPPGETTPAPAGLVPLSAADLLADPTRHGFEVFYGIPVSSVGEEGDLVAIGHHEPGQAIAAMNAYSRKVIGLRNLYDERGATFSEAEDMLGRSYATFLSVSDCKRRADDAAGGKVHRCDMCSEIESGGWWMRTSDEPVPGSFPVMLWST